MPMRVALNVMAAGHHEDPPLETHHVDLRAIEPRENGPGDHFVDRAERRLAAPEIEHLIDRIEQRVQLMRAEQHGDTEFALERFDEADHLLLMMRIETDQGLVEQKQLRLADQRLGEQKPLPFAARHFAERAAGKLPRSDEIEGAIDIGPLGLARKRQAEPMPIRAACDELPATQPQRWQTTTDLRTIADRRIAARRRPAEHSDAAGGMRHETEDRPASASSCRTHSARARR